MSPKEIAARLRTLAAERAGTLLADNLAELAKELDPPKPTRPEPGTVVRFSDEDFGIVTKDGIAWVNQDGAVIHSAWSSLLAKTGEPVHILADDEVAVKRSQIQALLGEVGE